MKLSGGNKLFLLQSLLFAFFALSFIFPSGNLHCINGLCTLSIGDWHLHDALWHIGFAKLGFTTWPLQNPFMAGESLTGYNYLLDYILNLLYRAGIDPLFSFFKLLPIIATILYIYSVWSYLRTVTTNPKKANLLAFFFYFGSSATYLAVLASGHALSGQALRGFPVVSVISPTTMFLNLQYAFSLSIFLWIMILRRNLTHFSHYFSVFILFLLMFGFKFYGGMVAVLYLSLSTFFESINHKNARSLLVLIPTLLASLCGGLIFYGFSKGSNWPFAWSPLALTHLMIDDQLLFGNHGLTLARYYLYEHSSGLSPRLWMIETYSILLFLIINFGTRLLGIFYGLKQFLSRRLSLEYLAIFLTIILTALVPILFVQEGGWYNTMQFLYYGTWLAGILTAEFLFKYLSFKTLMSWILAFLVFITTVPNIYAQLSFITAPQTQVTGSEWQVLEILHNLPPGIVHLSDPVHKLGLVPAIAQKMTFYLDTDQLMVTHAPYQDRLNLIKKYSGGSISRIPADYYLIYKQDYGSDAAIVALTSPQQYKLVFDSELVALYQKL